MAKKKQEVINSKELTPEEVECFKRKILKIQADCQVTIDSFNGKSEKDPAIGLDDRTLDTRIDSENELIKQRLGRYKSQIIECNNALTRIENGTFGICFISQKPIPKYLLEANPLRTRLNYEKGW